jgi:predicted small secreted protein
MERAVEREDIMKTSKMLVRVLTLVLAAFAATHLTACNTFSGAGKDIERGGEKIQGAAEGAKKG